jgi:hypothetical protein
MPLQATSGAASYDAFGGGVPAVPNYIEDVFSTWLYTGNDSTQNIVNGLDLSTKGGLVWLKARNAADYAHRLYDTNRGTGTVLFSNTTNAATAATNQINSFNSTGFTLGTNLNTNDSTINYASWTFRKQPKFFDVVTFTKSTASLSVPHNLGSVPGCVIIKATNIADEWYTYHRGLTSTSKFVDLNRTYAEQDAGASWITPTSTTVDLNGILIPADGNTYVMYVFAHNAGGFGLTSTDNVISCGSFTTDGSGYGTANLGWEPQWFMVKNTSGTGDWFILDSMRGFSIGQEVSTNSKFLKANVADAETASYGAGLTSTTSTGLLFGGSSSSTYIYIAIRRGPMKVPSTGSSVFSPVAYTANGAGARSITGSNFPVDLIINGGRSTGNSKVTVDRLRGLRQIQTTTTNAEASSVNSIDGLDQMDGVTVGTNLNRLNGETFVNWYFRRAPSFFDEVCYTGAGTSATTFSHNLQKQPELIIVKSRSTAQNWSVAAQTTASNYIWGLDLNTTAASQSPFDYGANMSATTFDAYIGTAAETVNSGTTYVAYLFATCAGVSKVGSYTGTATTKQIDCGFTGGARFVLIKRTDSTGDWYVWDSARGIVSGNDPYLLLNSTAAEVTNTDYIDTYSAGFEISSTAPAAINASGGTFIFLAIA